MWTLAKYADVLNPSGDSIRARMRKIHTFRGFTFCIIVTHQFRQVLTPRTEKNKTSVSEMMVLQIIPRVLIHSIHITYIFSLFSKTRVFIQPSQNHHIIPLNLIRFNFIHPTSCMTTFCSYSTMLIIIIILITLIKTLRCDSTSE